MEIFWTAVLWAILGAEIKVSRADIIDAPTCLPRCYLATVQSVYGPEYYEKNHCDEVTCGCGDDKFVKAFFEYFQEDAECIAITAQEASDALERMCLKSSVTLEVLNPTAPYSQISISRPPESTGKSSGGTSTATSTPDSSITSAPTSNPVTADSTQSSSVATISTGPLPTGGLNTSIPLGSTSIQPAQSTLSTSVNSQSSTTSAPTGSNTGHKLSPTGLRGIFGVTIPLLLVFLFI
ncbi:hypothetical protein TWF694_000184 [Orbilia ellipsospora]|uniref:Extracellular membrane protein CFEM domain-containing protein n=1 Tax=Orbilia ellipsospora TaxID=2528407 RepID=A0AAV9XMV3_9PEZI